MNSETIKKYDDLCADRLAADKKQGFPMEIYNTMLSKLIASLKSMVSTKEQILKDHVQDIYDANLTPQELREYISLAEFEEEDGGFYAMALCLEEEDLKSLTQEERKAFCREREDIWVNIWIEKDLCKGVDTDIGICDEEPWQYTWHGN